MIDVITRGSLGELGSLLLDFYITNALWINSIVAIYAVLVVWAHQGYQKVGNRIKEILISTYGESVKNKSEAWFTKTLERSDINLDMLARQVRDDAAGGATDTVVVEVSGYETYFYLPDDR